MKKHYLNIKLGEVTIKIDVTTRRPHEFGYMLTLNEKGLRKFTAFLVENTKKHKGQSHRDHVKDCRDYAEQLLSENVGSWLHFEVPGHETASGNPATIGFDTWDLVEWDFRHDDSVIDLLKDGFDEHFGVKDLISQLCKG